MSGCAMCGRAQKLSFCHLCYGCFTDYVYEGDTVDVYPTAEDAEWERGPSVPRVVCREGDEWWLRPKGER